VVGVDAAGTLGAVGVLGVIGAVGVVDIVAAGPQAATTSDSAIIPPIITLSIFLVMFSS